MATHRSAASLAIAQAKRFSTFVGNIHDAHKALAEAADKDAQEGTSGTISTMRLREMGHPFGRTSGGGQRGARKGTGKRRVATMPINRQTGRLQRSRFLDGPRGPNKVYKLGHRVSYAKFILSPNGTRKMVARGYFDFIRMRHRARKQGLLIAARKGLYKQ